MQLCRLSVLAVRAELGGGTRGRGKSADEGAWLAQGELQGAEWSWLSRGLCMGVTVTRLPWVTPPLGHPLPTVSLG